MSCISKKPTRKPSFYFAYGSNLHLAQMAQRCPGSKFVGKATLSGYEWQVKFTRGGQCDQVRHGLSVEGLLYLIDSKDEKCLDRSEGLEKKFYKILLEVTLERHEVYSDYETSRLSQLFAV